MNLNSPIDDFPILFYILSIYLVVKRLFCVQVYGQWILSYAPRYDQSKENEMVSNGKAYHCYRFVSGKIANCNLFSCCQCPATTTTTTTTPATVQMNRTERKITKSWTFVNTRHSSRKTKDGFRYAKVSSQSFLCRLESFASIYLRYQTSNRRFSTNYSWIRLRADSIRFIYDPNTNVYIKWNIEYDFPPSHCTGVRYCVVSPIPLCTVRRASAESRNECIVNWCVWSNDKMTVIHNICGQTAWTKKKNLLISYFG